MANVSDIRIPRWKSVKETVFDFAIIGGGINGATVYHELCKRGYSVLLVDKNDFAGGTSQASAMMVWGGLLYLRNFDISTVFRLSRARDCMVQEMRDLVGPCLFRYIPAPEGGRKKALVHSALYFYWLLGCAQRKKPCADNVSEALDSLKKENTSKGSLLYEEAMLKVSDSQFVLQWIVPFQSQSNIPLNYCSLEGGEYNSRDKLWYLHLSDMLGSNHVLGRARFVLNCGGVWADNINKKFAIKSPYKHAMSKGVFIGLKRPEAHVLPMMFETVQNDDALAYIPWGPVSLWGPTETKVDDIQEGFSATVDDIEFLLDHINRFLKWETTKGDILSIRCGIRPLAVKQSYNKNHYPLDLSRKSVLVEDEVFPWMSVYGGKLTGCKHLAEKIASKAVKKISPLNGKKTSDIYFGQEIIWNNFPSIVDRVPSMEWSIKNELCCTIEDYLRRRTNISQWIPREGLGVFNENIPHLFAMALKLHNGDQEKAKNDLDQYTKRIEERFDHILKKI